MDAIKAGLEKAQEALHMKKAEDCADKAHDPTVKPSERVDAAFAAGKAANKADEHGFKAEVHKEKHASS
ncbi:unnamed protein product [Adineta steineri]|uniref:Uncharacterized protein n=1 Tax=Adineta steineri TaxID=433720 RepID=A0A816E648_9BILA|nr:unnamed protein product [Adineta steineri]CAF1645720.1 unnamed protein product [Adineta steineri]